MSDTAKKQPKPPASKDGKKPDKSAEKQKEDSADVERAVYDGMQDLRVKKPR